MIEMGKVEDRVKAVNAALDGLNELEKDFVIQQYMTMRMAGKQKQKQKDAIGNIDIKSLMSRMMKGGSKDGNGDGNI